MEENSLSGAELDVRITLAPGARAPEYASSGASGADLAAFLDEEVVLRPGERAAIPTGIFMEIPPGWEGQVRPRSGLALKRGIGCLNSPGTIDSDYRGEIKVILVNHSDEDFPVRDGDRIAQMVFTRVWKAAFRSAGGLSGTERGSGGFGSTGTR